MDSDSKKKSTGSAISAFDHFMGRIRGFFAETIAEMKRCTWPDRNELFESTILVVVAIVMVGIFVAVVDTITRYFIKLITTGTIF